MKKNKDQDASYTRLRRFVENHLFPIILILFALCIIWRFVYFYEMQASPYGNHLTMDSLYHDQWAKEIASGKLINDDVFFRAPLYPYVIGIIYFFSHGNQIVVTFIQMFLGVLSCFVIYLIAKKIGNTMIGIIAFFISAIYGMFIYFENELLIVSLILFLNIIALYIILLAKEKKKWYFWLSAGFLLGLSAIARPNILLFVLTIPIWIIMTMRKKEKPLSIIFFCLFGIIGLLLPIVPVMVHNYIVGDDFVPIASQGGVNFFIGNNPSSDGRTAIVPGTRESWWGGYEDQITIAKNALHDPYAKPSKISGYWFSQGLHFIVNDFPGFLALTLKKLYMFWNAYEIGNNRDIRFITRHFILFRFLTIKFWFIASFAIAGFFLYLKEKKDISLFVFFIISYMISVIIFFVNARYRMPIIPLLIIGTAIMCDRLLRTILQKNGLRTIFRNKDILTACAIALLCAGCMFPFVSGEDNPAQNYFHEALAYESKGDIPRAIDSLSHAIHIDPSYVKGYVNLGALYLTQTKEYDKALETCEKALSVSPHNLKALFNAGLASNALNNRKKAKEYFLQITQTRTSTNTEDHSLVSLAHRELGFIFESEGNYIKALFEFKSSVSMNPNSHTGWTAIGRIYVYLKQQTLALEAIHKALTLAPHYDPALKLLEDITK